jgi:mannose-6-phosphate isomerase-like protein (cupin superfamily)
MPAIESYRPDTEWMTPERCFITELANSVLDEACSIALARVNPGVTTQWHALATSVERYVILEGEGQVEVGNEEPQRVARLDVVTIPAGVRQRITNNGTRDLLFLCVCTPPFAPEAYIALGSGSD